MSRCERCGFTDNPVSYALMDYCVDCGKNLCEECIAKGCCGAKPARSGMEEDSDDDDGSSARKGGGA